MRLFSKGSNTKTIEQVILEHYQQYYRLAYSYVHNEADASDIVQNGAYKALRSEHTLQNPEYAESWVYRIMINECFLYYRARKHASYEELQEDLLPDLSYTTDPCEQLDLRQAIDTLEEKDKALIILRYFEDKKLEEIAEILEENVSTVKSRLYRSLKKLRLSLSGQTDTPAKQPQNKIGR